MRRFVITEQLDGSWLLVESDDHGNVWPTTEKRSAREIVARLSQLLGIGPVAPQTHAEIVELGESDLADDAPPLESLLAISEPPAAPTAKPEPRCPNCGTLHGITDGGYCQTCSDTFRKWGLSPVVPTAKPEPRLVEYQCDRCDRRISMVAWEMFEPTCHGDDDDPEDECGGTYRPADQPSPPAPAPEPIECPHALGRHCPICVTERAAHQPSPPAPAPEGKP